MSYIPQAMSGREIQHDIKFASDGPVCGLVDGVQSITLSGTTALTLTAGDNQMKCHVLIVDPAGSNTLKLPGYASADLNMVGRRISIFNNASDSGELITLQDANNAFICFVGYGDSVELVVASQDSSTGALEYLLLTKEFKHTITVAANGNADIIPSVGTDSFILPKYFVFTGDQDLPTATASIEVASGVDIVEATNMPDLANDGAKQMIYSADFANVLLLENQKLNYVGGGASASTVEITVVYSLISIA
jgi:hypothetical protein